MSEAAAREIAQDAEIARLRDTITRAHAEMDRLENTCDLKDAEIERLKGIITELIEQLVFYEGDEQIGVSAELMKRAREARGGDEMSEEATEKLRADNIWLCSEIVRLSRSVSEIEAFKSYFEHMEESYQAEIRNQKLLIARLAHFIDGAECPYPIDLMKEARKAIER